MKTVLSGAALLAVVGFANAQTFVPRIGSVSGGTWSQEPSAEMNGSAQRLATTRTLSMPNESVAPSATVSLAEEVPPSSPALPLVPISGAVLGVTVVSIGVGTKSRWIRSRA